ncbi:unnamed protein product, partial [Rhizoctonia solani]
MYDPLPEEILSQLPMAYYDYHGQQRNSGIMLGELFGMEGMPAPSMAAYKRRQEGTSVMHQERHPNRLSRCPKVDYRPPTGAEPAAQVAAVRFIWQVATSCPSAPAVSGAPMVFGGPLVPLPFISGVALINLGAPPLGMFPPPGAHDVPSMPLSAGLLPPGTVLRPGVGMPSGSST